MATITIIGSGMMGSALAFPARENGHTMRLVGTHLDREIISACQKTNRHPKFTRDFPAGVEYYQIEALDEAFGKNVCSLKDKPTNGEFIALVSDRLRIKESA